VLLSPLLGERGAIEKFFGFSPLSFLERGWG